MKNLMFTLALILIAGSAFASDLGQTQTHRKNDNHVGRNLGLPDGREGGETMETAVPIVDVPYYDTGNTSDNIDDYDVACPYTGSTSPDVVYRYTPAADSVYSLDMCGSGYDTRIWIFDEDQYLIACNDDYYDDDECGQYVSLIEAVLLLGGQTYYIIIDGYGGDAGDYIMAFNPGTTPPPCELVCTGVPEGEPTLMDGYEDLFNSGCNDNSGIIPFQTLEADENGDLVFCGLTGWFQTDDQGFRDTDWFQAVIGATGTVEWILEAEEETYAFLLGPHECDIVGVLQEIEADDCSSATMVIQGQPGEVIWLWVGPSDYLPPLGFAGNEYNCISTFGGLAAGVVTTDRISFDRIKSLYR